MMETLMRGDLPEFTNPNAYQMLEIGEYIYARSMGRRKEAPSVCIM